VVSVAPASRAETAADVYRLEPWAVPGPDQDGDPPVPDALVLAIERQRAVVDRRLARPARWRGPLRRELCGYPNADERARLGAVFDRLVVAGADGRDLDVELLLETHRALTGEGRFRDRPVRVGRGNGPRLRCAPVREVPDRVADAIHRAATSPAPAPIASARLHLELLHIHPFRDANGRSARLMAATVLARGGYRSTLFTAVEQHFRADPPAYHRAFVALAERGPDDPTPWIGSALRAMWASSAAVVWLRTREAHLRAVLAGVGATGAEADRLLVEFDLGCAPAGGEAGFLTGHAEPWAAIRAHLPRRARSELMVQLRRLREEEADDAASLTHAT